MNRYPHRHWDLERELAERPLPLPPDAAQFASRPPPGHHACAFSQSSTTSSSEGLYAHPEDEFHQFLPRRGEVHQFLPRRDEVHQILPQPIPRHSVGSREIHAIRPIRARHRDDRSLAVINGGFFKRHVTCDIFLVQFVFLVATIVATVYLYFKLNSVTMKQDDHVETLRRGGVAERGVKDQASICLNCTSLPSALWPTNCGLMDDGCGLHSAPLMSFIAKVLSRNKVTHPFARPVAQLRGKELKNGNIIWDRKNSILTKVLFYSDINVMEIDFAGVYYVYSKLCFKLPVTRGVSLSHTVSRQCRRKKKIVAIMTEKYLHGIGAPGHECSYAGSVMKLDKECFISVEIDEAGRQYVSHARESYFGLFWLH